MTSRNSNRCPTHPGELLREDILPKLDLSRARIAECMGVSRQCFYNVVNEKASVTPAIAVRLAKLFDNDPLFWLQMQDAYDVWHAQREVDVSTVPNLMGAG